MKKRLTTQLLRSLAGLGLGVVLAGTLQGCTSAKFGELEIEQQSWPPLPIEVSASGLTIPVGIAVKFKVKPVSDSTQQYTSNDELRFESANRSIAGVFQIEETSQVVITGARVGSACMRVLVNDAQVDCLQLTIVDQDPPPSGDR